ncbi:MAG: efflux RND transporter permease subunit [Pseudomonadales bacterium]|nr:efflux RND transporter permease subunit [Pseudomonadales bacterium]
MSFPNLSALAVRERSVTLFFLILSVLAGIYAFTSMGRAEDPTFTVRVMKVSVAWPGTTTQELQEQVVNRLEKRIQEVEYLYRIRTTIRPGRADLTIEFEGFTPQEQLPELFYQVRKRMQDEAPSLPKGVIGPIVNDDFADVYFSLIALSAPGLPMRELTREAELILDRLQRIQGVQKVMLLGERPERVYVEFDNVKLVNLGIDPRAIFEAIDANNRINPVGHIETEGPRVYLRIAANLSDSDQLASVPIRIGNRVIKLSDIASIRRGYEDPPRYLIRSRSEDAILLGVVMAKGENGLAFGERFEDFVREEQEKMPLGLSLTIITNQTEAITAAVNQFQVKFLIAVIVVMAISIMALGLRAGLVVGIAVPVTLGITFMLMSLMEINLDRITLGALIIALGLLVDDAIIAVEMMLVKMEEGWDRVRAASHAWTATAAPMLFGTLVTVAGFFPIGFAKSGVGEYAGNIFWVVGAALIVSWVVALTFIPYLGVKLLPDFKGDSISEDSLYKKPCYVYLRVLIVGCVKHRKMVVSATVLLLVLAIMGLVGAVQKQFFPGSDRPEVLIGVYLPQGSSIETTERSVRKLEAILSPMTEVKTLSSYIGAGAPRFFISANPESPDPAFGKVIAVAKNAASRDSIMAKVNQVIKDGEFPEARLRVYRLLYGPPVTWPVSFRVVGSDPLQLRRIAYQVREIMMKNPNVVTPNLDWNERVPVMHLSMDVERLRLLGLTPIEVSQQLQFQLDGQTVTEVRQDIRTVDVVAKGLANTSGFEVLTREGRKIPLTQLGSIDIRFEEPVIKRYNREPYLGVNADVRGAQANDVTKAVWRALEGVRAQLPVGYRIDVGGAVEKSNQANASIRKLQPVMIALMFIFIMFQMRSFSGTFIVVATAPLGLIGAVAALLLFNEPFGFVALLGLTGLAGILMRNTLILTQQVSDNISAGFSPFDAVVEAAVRRARPVVLTALAAMFAFIPLTFDSFWGPLAYVLIGGVTVGTAITLLFVPALYALWFRLKLSTRE